MTLKRGLAEAQRRWGITAKVRKITVFDDSGSFTYFSVSAGITDTKGEGDTLKAMFADADRRASKVKK